VGRAGRPSYGVTRLTLPALERKKKEREEEKKAGECGRYCLEFMDVWNFGRWRRQREGGVLTEMYSGTFISPGIKWGYVSYVLWSCSEIIVIKKTFVMCVVGYGGEGRGGGRYHTISSCFSCFIPRHRESLGYFSCSNDGFT